MLLSYTELMELVEQGVITADPSLVNGASIDVRLGDTVMVEKVSHGIERIIDLSQKEELSMILTVIPDNGLVLKPNQFILASTVEEFNLPNDIASEFKLKSSIARAGLNHLLAGWCLTGDTNISLLDGREVKIADLVGVECEVYSINDNGDICHGKSNGSFITKYVDTTVKVVLDDGASFELTPDHKVMLRDGTYVAAGELQSGAALMPLYRRTNLSGYEECYCPSLVARGNWLNPIGRWRTTHKLIKPSGRGFVTHHVNEVKSDNRMDNLDVMTVNEHNSLHRSEYARSEEGRDRSRSHARQLIHRLWESESFREMHSAKAAVQANALNKKRWIDEREFNRSRASEQARQQGFAEIGQKWISENKLEHRKAVAIGYMSLTIAKILEAGLPVNEESYVAHKRQNAPRVSTIVDLFGSFDKCVSATGYKNHTVKSVDFIIRSTPIPVYDITVSPRHNFALSAGVFVHNCDPGWHNSRLTLELKNNGEYHSLLLRAGMKIGQMKFYRVKPVPEQHSYAVKGRYNNTTEVTGSKGV